MTQATSKIDFIRERLQAAFAPSYLEVIDESDQHIGHAGHQGGGRHFAIVIRADCFINLTRIAAHRQIYALFAEHIPEHIHALRIQILT